MKIKEKKHICIRVIERLGTLDDLLKFHDQIDMALLKHVKDKWPHLYEQAWKEIRNGK